MEYILKGFMLFCCLGVVLSSLATGKGLTKWGTIIWIFNCAVWVIL